MPGSGVRSGRRWDTRRGLQENKNKIKISLWQGFKGGHRIQGTALQENTIASLLCPGLSSWFKRGVMDGLESPVVKSLTVTRMPFVPDQLCKQLSLQRSRKRSHHFWGPSPPGRQRLATSPSSWGRQRRHLPQLRLLGGPSAEIELIAQVGIGPAPQG